MIGSLTGRLLLKQPPVLIVDVGGIGYECEAPMSTFYALPATGETVSLHTHLSIRDDAHLLYAFSNAREKALFRQLIKVSGVGPKIALAILSGISVDDFWATVREGQSGRLTKVPGIGKKSAERLLVELRDKAGASGQPATVVSPGVPASPEQEARSALEALGYRSADAQRMVEQARQEGFDAEQIIREALKRAVR